jgi:hypothetical protein
VLADAVPLLVTPAADAHRLPIKEAKPVTRIQAVEDTTSQASMFSSADGPLRASQEWIGHADCKTPQNCSRIRRRDLPRPSMA